MRRFAVPVAVLAASLVLGSSAWAGPRDVTLRYTTSSALDGLQVTMRLDALGVAVVHTSDPAALRRRPGIAWVRPTVARIHLGSAPAPVATPAAGEWQYAATRANLVPSAVRRAAAAMTIAIVDTGADLTAPNIAAKTPVTFSTVSGESAVTDTIGHGTFVASVAGGGTVRGSVFQGFGGDARLMIVQANSNANDFTDATEAAAIVWAVDRGARIINLSLGGPDTSQVEQDALAYAANHGVLLVAAAGNNGDRDGGLTYPAALLGPTGIAVGASTHDGAPAPFSSTASYVSLLAPGVGVLGELSSTAPTSAYQRARVPGDGTGAYGYGTGTSYAAPQVAGAAALVWAANPSLTATQVIQLLRRTATPRGILDVAAAVARAQGKPAPPSTPSPAVVLVRQVSPATPSFAARTAVVP